MKETQRRMGEHNQLPGKKETDRYKNEKSRGKDQKTKMQDRKRR